MSRDAKGCGCLLLLGIFAIAGVLALGAWKKQAGCEWAKRNAPARAEEACR